MDGSRFDEVARTTAARLSRRGFLAGVSGVAAGLVGGRAATAHGDCHYQCVPPPDLCRHAYCQDDNTCVIAPVECEEGLACVEGICEQCTPTAAFTNRVIETQTYPVYLSCDTSDSFHYASYPFIYCGGPFTVRVRGQASGGGTLPDPFVALYEVGFDPNNPCTRFIASDNDSGCGSDALLSFADLNGGRYTVVVGVGADSEVASWSYTLEINQPEPQCLV